VRYGQARLRAALADGDAELDRREARLEADAADKPWLRSTSTSPTLDDVRARIEHDSRSAAAERTGNVVDAPTPTSRTGGDPGMDFDLSQQRHQADDRLAAIRRELGLGGAEADPGGPPSKPPPSDAPPPAAHVVPTITDDERAAVDDEPDHPNEQPPGVDAEPPEPDAVPWTTEVDADPPDAAERPGPPVGEAAPAGAVAGLPDVGEDAEPPNARNGENGGPEDKGPRPPR